MKLIPTPSKITAYAAALALVGFTAYATSVPATAEWNPETLEATMATQGEQLKDHEARLKTVEGQTASNTQAISDVKTAVDNLPTATPGQVVQAIKDVTAAVTPTPTPTTRVEVSRLKGFAYHPGGIQIGNAPYEFADVAPTGVGVIPAIKITYDDGTTTVVRADGSPL